MIDPRDLYTVTLTHTRRGWIWTIEYRGCIWHQDGNLVRSRGRPQTSKTKQECRKEALHEVRRQQALRATTPFKPEPAETFKVAP